MKYAFGEITAIETGETIAYLRLHACVFPDLMDIFLGLVYNVERVPEAEAETNTKAFDLFPLVDSADIAIIPINWTVDECFTYVEASRE